MRKRCERWEDMKEKEKKKPANEVARLYGLHEMSFKELINGLRFHLHHLKQWNPRLYAATFLSAVPELLMPTLGILLPTFVVKGLEQGWQAERYLLYVGMIILIMLLANLLKAKIQSVITSQFDHYRCHYLKLLSRKMIDIDYDILESQAFQDKKNSAYFWIQEWVYDGHIDRVVKGTGKFLASIVCLIGYGYFLVSVNGWLLVLIIVSVLLSVTLSIKALIYAHIYWNEINSVRRKRRYLVRHIRTFSEGKDIRLYGLQHWFMKMYHDFSIAIEKYLDKAQNGYCLETIVYCIFVCLRDGIAYSFLVVQILGGKMSVSDFVFYTGLVAGFSEWFRLCVQQLQYFMKGGYVFYVIRKALDMDDRWKGSEKVETLESEEGVTITLKDVCFSYDEKRAILDHVNLTINKGERLALVGLNGAGKTTLVKLLCGFYTPKSGSILVNDRPIDTYERESYYQMVSAVFQDAGILPNSILENVSCKTSEATDRELAKKCLMCAGLWEKVSELPLKEETQLVRELSEEAIAFSGGERQKLLLARALYKGGNLLILDEPTAALDPIAENEIYLKYHALTNGKTSLFISHRLSSTRFCDRIILLDNGKIVEEGTHNELMALGGKYAQMFEMQSQYYKEQEKNEAMKAGDELAI